jgi:hypothetical protein
MRKWFEPKNVEHSKVTFCTSRIGQDLRFPDAGRTSRRLPDVVAPGVAADSMSPPRQKSSGYLS